MHGLTNDLKIKDILQKVIINCRFLTQPVSGVQRFALEITRQLLSIRGMDYICVAPKEALKHDHGLPFEVTTIGYFSGYLWEQFELPIYLRRFRNPLLLNLANSGPLVFSNNLVTVHDIAFTKNKAWFSPVFRQTYNFIIPKLLRKAKKVITVSEFSKLEIKNTYGIPDDKICVAYNGSEHLFQKNTPSKKERFYLTVGSMDPRKNLNTIIDAFVKLGYPLKIVGGSSSAFPLLDLRSSPNVEFLGRIGDTELISLYKRARGFIYLSLYEGFGIPPIEALLSGTRPIVSDISVFREILGEHAIYCDPTNLEDIVNTMTEFDSNESSRKVSLSEIDDLQKSYSWEKSAILIEKLLQAL